MTPNSGSVGHFGNVGPVTSGGQTACDDGRIIPAIVVRSELSTYGWVQKRSRLRNG